MSTESQLEKYQPYPEYKDSGVEWMGDVPQHWKETKFKHECQFLGGGTPSKDNQSYWSGNIPWVSPKDMKSHFICDSIDKISSKAVTESSTKLVPINSLLIVVRSGILQRTIPVAINTEPVTLNQDMKALCFNDFQKTAFHYYFIQGLESELLLEWCKQGATVESIEHEYLSNSKYFIPNNDEITNIVAFLDYETTRIDKLITKQQQLIELLKEKRQAVISHAVTKGLNPNAPMKDSGVEWLGEVPEHWVVARLKQAIESGSSISYGIVQPGDALDEGIPFIQTTNISQGNLDLETLPKTSVSIEKDYPRSRLKGGEVILGIRASIGAAYVVPEELKGVNLSRGVARIQPGNLITSDFLVCFFKTNSVEQYWGLSKQGSTFSEVSIETVRELRVVLPPLKEQQEICFLVESISNKFKNIVDSAERQNKLLMERRTALISAAVTGKIDLRGWKPPQNEVAA